MFYSALTLAGFALIVGLGAATAPVFAHTDSAREDIIDVSRCDPYVHVQKATARTIEVIGETNNKCIVEYANLEKIGTAYICEIPTDLAVIYYAGQSDNKLQTLVDPETSSFCHLPAAVTGNHQKTTGHKGLYTSSLLLLAGIYLAFKTRQYWKTRGATA